ncbi:lipopolysaccharide transport system ATP-binding protein [Anseongella ginsenosidimutans]|uniref:Lipopolysaccharide transport system ATP-binding protein n=1 Tax=Anseongella ginsenosidimutans TaxID=496056 RepID=A0A4R3KXX4_9SPHI|nr:ABC transporter ATP-binding protein [Anseongella ginsenosidimutans]QEC51212.1 ABC transporter ATP-binding protein [Anseongella ginsenosidimutans]TCS90114.1 lipopolysaccharide transport system ATP-binding protein [Anseongella ginsenosidimutans]
MDPVISVENVSKYYRLGALGSGSLKRDLLDWWKGRKEAPAKDDQSRDHIWALQDISFDVPQGEVLGFVGKNGAGKSTLLKIISRISLPTTGRVRGKGRVASLLEVGTGFHEELTGRENIFLNGNILGMKRREIAARFDEIVAFSGVERFIDTPIKRYSSGMYVRLAFAVAAHLEPAVLLVDEVLAVGDAEFQRKCLGKMKEASSVEGKTVLFVTHNMQAINNLCTRAIWLEKGKIIASGEPQTITNNYLAAFQRKLWKQQWDVPGQAPGNEHIRMMSVELLPHLEDPMCPVDIRTPITVKFRFYNLNKEVNLAVGIHLFTLGGECIFDVSHPPAVYRKGVLEGECTIPGNFLNDGSYYFSIIVVKDTSQPLFYFEECLFFEVEDYRENMAWFGKWMGYVRPQFPVTLTQL